jgi:hypothetical protein
VQTPRVSLYAESEHDARERATAELDAPSASQALGCCKHQSSSRAAGVALPLPDKGSRASAGAHAHRADHPDCPAQRQVHRTGATAASPTDSTRLQSVR